VHRARIQLVDGLRRRPCVAGALARRHEEIEIAAAAIPVRLEQHFSPIESHGRAAVGIDAVHFGDGSRRADRSSLSVDRHHEDVGRDVARAALEVELGRSVVARLRNERRELGGGRVDVGPQCDWYAPRQVIRRVRAGRHIDVIASRTARTVAREEEQERIHRQRGAAVATRAIDEGTQVHGGPPGVAFGRAPRHPQVVAARAAGSIGAEVKRETIRRKRRSLLVGRRTVHWCVESHRSRPVRFLEGLGYDASRGLRALRLAGGDESEGGQRDSLHKGLRGSLGRAARVARLL